MSWDCNKAWYHGSPVKLTTISAGSTITQDRRLARVFSHKPAFVVQETSNTGVLTIKHSGQQPGYLYRIAEEVGPSDVYPHPQTAMADGQEWLTRRELRVELVERTEVVRDECLTIQEIAALQGRISSSRSGPANPCGPD